MSDSSADRNPVEVLAEEFLARDRRGERPSLSEYVTRYPDLADAIRELFPVLLEMEDVRPSGEESPFRGAGPAASVPRRLGDFLIIREIGRGGMGIVFEAEQVSLGRRVALKIMTAGAITAQQVRRFDREVRAAALLHHTNIVPVFGVGEEAGTRYYVMQFIPGQPLDEVLKDLRRLRRQSKAPAAAAPRPNGPRSQTNPSAAELAESLCRDRFAPTVAAAAAADGPAPALTIGSAAVVPESSGSASGGANVLSSSADPGHSGRRYARRVARIGVQVADALEYAATQGVIHRDVKPANLLLDPQGTVWVTDFGLAKAAGQEDLTDTGDLVGTLRYMAPERFRGHADHRSDIYALGLTLYELLALQPAFDDADRVQLIRRVTHEEPPRLEKVDPSIPRDLATIVHKAAAREPAERYYSAGALGDDLRRFLEDRPIAARRPSWHEVTWRWCHRNPAVASLLGLLTVILVAGSVLSGWAAYHYNRLSVQERTARFAAEEADRKAQRRFKLAMEAVRALSTGAAEDVILREPALANLRLRLLGQSKAFHAKLKKSLEGDRARASRLVLAEALVDAAELYHRVEGRETALKTHREAQASLAALVREQPGDIVARRDLARSHLAVAAIFKGLGQLENTRAEISLCRAALGGVPGRHPEDGGARFLDAEADSLEAESFISSAEPLAARQALQRVRARYERLIADNPPFTLPTLADGATEYRRGFVMALGRMAHSFLVEGRWDETLRIEDTRAPVLGALPHGAFFDDEDRRLQAVHAVRRGSALRFLGQADLAIQSFNEALAIYQRLSNANPVGTSFKANVAEVKCNLGSLYRERGDYARARSFSRQALEGHSALPPESRKQLMPSGTAGECVVNLALCDLAEARLEEAKTQIERAVSIFEEVARTNPAFVFPNPHRGLGDALVHQAVIEWKAGRLAAARQAAARVASHVERRLRRYPHQRPVLHWKALALLLESILDLESGRRDDAAMAADHAATVLETLQPLILHQEHFDLGVAHALLYAVGRPGGGGREPENPGLGAHAEQAIAELTMADRMGFRYPAIEVLVHEILGRRPGIDSQVLGEPFPVDPLQPADPTGPPR
jgi:serine/threonine protein kinase